MSALRYRCPTCSKTFVEINAAMDHEEKTGHGKAHTERTSKP